MASISPPVWTQARDAFRQTLKDPEDVKAFDAAFNGKDSYDDFVAVVDAAQQASSGKTAKAMVKLRDWLEPLQQLAPVFDVVSQINSLIGCSLWGPLKLILIVRNVLSTIT